ncbi:precorrin-2 C(20)-methyltransferase [Arhodomonas sp. AD133]|uniref:precorrin-2 C(20)-methyltransferase n=1 Tax=Arhodomonas sp. AD133 TaxID=3415009 RepID=UPI003EBBE207
MTGTVWGIGVGPGAPDLLTLRAANRLAAATTVCYIAAPNRPSRARAIAAPHLREGVDELPVTIPMSKDRSAAQSAYTEAAGTLAARTAAGEDVAVLCEGDPLLYASFGYLREHLNDDVPVEVVPGISSVGAASARIGRALTRQDEDLVVLTTRSSDGAIRAALRDHAAIAILKAGPQRQRLAGLIRESGRAADAVYLEQVGGPEETLHAGLEDLPSGRGPYFAIFLVFPEASA